MGNPNLVRKISNSPDGSSGEISPSSVISTSNFSKNYIINGDMTISQRGTSFSAVANAQYTLDRWVYFKSGAMVHTVSKDTDVPSVSESGVVFQNSLRLNLTTPDTSIAAGDYAHIQQKIEGYNWTYLAQKDFTISFWVKATLPGTYCINLRNGVDIAYIAEYTILQSDIWEYKTIQIAASPSIGTWNYTNGIGIALTFVLAGGSNFVAAPETWHNANTLFNTSNQVNGVNTGATNFKITGVMINEGVIAAPFKLFSESFDSELRACQRYYEKSYNLDIFPGAVNNTGTSGGYVSRLSTGGILTTKFSVSKRANPAVIPYSPINGAANSIAVFPTTTVAIAGVEVGISGFNVISADTAGVNSLGWQWTADAEL